MPHVDMLFNQVQKRNTNAVHIQKNIQTFQMSIEKEKEGMEAVSKDVENGGGTIKEKKSRKYVHK